MFMAVCWRDLPLLLGKVWLSPYADLRVRNLSMKHDAEFMEGG